MDNKIISQFINQLLEHQPLLTTIINHLINKGASVYLVGGAVRDIILKREIYDIDIEVHQLSLESLRKVLMQYGMLHSAGKSFGVLRISTLNVDWSLPRKDSKGRHPVVIIDNQMSIEHALRRRDLTMNAMAINLLTHQLIDPFNGLKDINNKVLRTPDPLLFVEDPLRFYRVVQFIGRFEMIPDKELSDICAAMSVDGVAQERIIKEFDKLFSLSRYPSKALIWLESINRLETLFAELSNNDFNLLDRAAQQFYAHSKERQRIMYASFCHSLKKETFNYYKQLHADNWSIASLKPVLQKITSDACIVKPVSALVYFQAMPLEFIKNNAPDTAYKILAYQLELYGTNIHELCLVARAINDDSAVEMIEQFRQKSIDLKVYTQAQQALVKAKDLLAFMPPSKYLGEQLKKAYLLQINNGICNKEKLLAMIIKQQ